MGKVDKRRFNDDNAHMRRFEILAYIDANSGRGRTFNLYVSDVAEALGAEKQTVRGYLRWLEKHKWIFYPKDQRQVRKGNAGGRAHSVVSVRYDRTIGGVSVEDWLRWNHAEWLAPGHLVLQATRRRNHRAVLRFGKRECTACGHRDIFPKNGRCPECKYRQKSAYRRRPESW